MKSKPYTYGTGEAYYQQEQSKMNKHAKLMQEYAKDWANTYEPWTLWQCRDTDAIVTKWTDLCNHPTWSEQFEYRRKPQTRTITLPPTNDGDAEIIVAAYDTRGIRLADFNLGRFFSEHEAVQYLQQLQEELK